MKSVQEQKSQQDEDVTNLKAMTEKMKKKIEYCKEQMEQGNTHIQELTEKKNQYKKQITALKQSGSQNLGSKDTIINK